MGEVAEESKQASFWFFDVFPLFFFFFCSSRPSHLGKIKSHPFPLSQPPNSKHFPAAHPLHTQIPYKVVEDSSGNVKIDCPNAGNKQFAAEEISAAVLRKLCDDASKFLGDSVGKAVITVPAYFNDSQRQATKGWFFLIFFPLSLPLSERSPFFFFLLKPTKHTFFPPPLHPLTFFPLKKKKKKKTDAGKIAGLEVLRIINEPTAASLAYGFEKKSNETILVFDLGGGTFDVSVLEVGDGVFEVLSTSGDTHLGGDDFDKRIVDWLAADFKANEGIDLVKDRQALQRLTEAAEKAKMELSSTTQTSISLPFITATAEGPKHIEATLTRAKFEELCSDLLDRCRVPVEQALKDGASEGAHVRAPRFFFLSSSSTLCFPPSRLVSHSSPSPSPPA